ncbi:hypothetical protein H8F24_17315 [Synechococcus sp. CBW1002]|jgi:hypothetical protein|uniref:hypothetical protein n=1 Tax=Synechococcus sp. CBW1002 TaxID=1353134 RepID=UPI0018CF9D7E|nr:hypothetical protein [Synechococcus sp. CBW1002]QPN59692.1 hypothetical protein H8F24_17315 [Synechococcus sp. CBW1002]
MTDAATPDAATWLSDLGDLFDRVEQVAGVPLQTLWVSELEDQSILLPASDADPVHRILYRDNTHETTPYLVAMEAVQLLRVLQAPGEQQLAMLPRREARERVVSEAERRNRDLSLAQQRKVGLNLYNTTLSQLRTVPPAMAVDRWLFEQLPQLRSRQDAFLRQQCQELAEGLALGMDRRMPPLVLQANRAMDAAYAIHAATLSGVPEFSLPYQGSAWEELGTELLQLAQASTSDAAESTEVSDPDRQVIDAWAERLGIARWYDWS